VSKAILIALIPVGLLSPPSPPKPARVETRVPICAFASCRRRRDLGGRQRIDGGVCRGETGLRWRGTDMYETFLVPFDYDVLRARRDDCAGSMKLRRGTAAIEVATVRSADIPVAYWVEHCRGWAADVIALRAFLTERVSTRAAGAHRRFPTCRGALYRPETHHMSRASSNTTRVRLPDTAHELGVE
jgi:hypothetical protein